MLASDWLTDCDVEGGALGTEAAAISTREVTQPLKSRKKIPQLNIKGLYFNMHDKLVLPAKIIVTGIAPKQVLAVADMPSVSCRALPTAKHCRVVRWPQLQAESAGRAGHTGMGGD